MLVRVGGFGREADRNFGDRSCWRDSLLCFNRLGQSVGDAAGNSRNVAACYADIGQYTVVEFVQLGYGAGNLQTLDKGLEHGLGSFDNQAADVTVPLSLDLPLGTLEAKAAEHYVTGIRDPGDIGTRFLDFLAFEAVAGFVIVHRQRPGRISAVGFLSGWSKI